MQHLVCSQSVVVGARAKDPGWLCGALGNLRKTHKCSLYGLCWHTCLSKLIPKWANVLAYESYLNIPNLKINSSIGALEPQKTTKTRGLSTSQGQTTSIENKQAKPKTKNALRCLFACFTCVMCTSPWGKWRKRSEARHPALSMSLPEPGVRLATRKPN